MNTASAAYPIGTSGTPWGDAERAQWLSRQARERSYESDVLSVVGRLRSRFDVQEYGRLEYGPDVYPLMAIRSRNWRADRPVVLITGGVHGYETSGVHGALQFVEQHAADYASRVNLLVAPCVSPWAYERSHRWNANAIDPNRSFRDDGQAGESAALIQLVASIDEPILLHIDLHETTDTDETEFRPARYSVSVGAAWPLHQHDQRPLQDHHRGIPRQRPSDPRAMQCRAGCRGVCGDQLCAVSRKTGTPITRSICILKISLYLWQQVLYFLPLPQG
ncbi:MAG: M14 family metallocarboxypeptidase, partial [Marinobacter sp.]